MEGVRVSIASVGKPKGDLECSLSAESLPSQVEKRSSRGYCPNLWLKWPVCDFRDHQNPKHRQPYRSQEIPSMNSNYSPSEGSVVGSSKE